MNPAHTYNRDVFSAHAESLSKLSARMVRGSEVLELGPASGYFTRILKEALQCKVDAIEIDPAMAAKAKPYCRDIQVADLDTLDWNALWPERRYDAIIAADVLEHLRNPERALQALLRRLKPEGKLLISLPNIAYAGMIFGLLEDDFRYRAEGLLDQTHLRFFTRTTLEETLAKSGWGVTWRGEVGKDLYEAEFHTRLETWPSALRDFVCNHPDRRAYQLLCECVPRVRMKESAPSIDFAAPSAPQFAARLLWAGSAAEVNYERGVTTFGHIGVAAQTLTWKLPEAAPYVRIRLADRAGYMRITAISLTDPAGNRRAFSIAECTLSEDVAYANDTLLLSSAEAWLALPPENYLAGSTLALQCGWPMSGDFVAAGETFDALRAAHQKHIETLGAEIKQVQSRAEAFEKNMLEREALITERDRQIAQRNAHATHLETLVTERERLIVERDQQLTSTNARAENAEAATHALRTQSETTIAQLQEQVRARDDQIAYLKTARGWVRSKLKS
jgi:O-antigen biosynthesis protein